MMPRASQTTSIRRRRASGAPWRAWGGALLVALAIGRAGPAVASDPTHAPPTLIETPTLRYPVGVDAGAQEVVLELRVGPDGEVVDALPRAGEPAFVEAALAAARGLRFTPATEDGVPVAVTLPLTLRFPEPPVNLAGTVQQRGDQAPVPDLLLLVGDRTVRTDAAGRFEVRNLAPGSTLVRVSSPGWRLPETALDVVDDTRLDVTLWVVDDAYTREAVGTYRVAPEPGVRSTLSREDVAVLPGTLGDPVRALQNTPGLVRTPLDAGWLLVRGGHPLDTGLYLDGVRVPLLFHLGGLTSIIHPEMVESITLSPGAPPARLGRSLAGAAEIQSRRPADDLHLAAGLSVAWAHAFVEAPIGDDVAFSASVRRSWLDAALGVVLSPEQARIAPRFWDAQARIDHEHAGLLLVGLSDQADVPNGDGTVSVVTQEALQAQGRVSGRTGDVALELRPWVAVHRQRISSQFRDEDLTDLFPGARVEATGQVGASGDWRLGVEGEAHSYRIARDADRRTTPYGWADPYAEIVMGEDVRVRAGMRLESLFVRGQRPRFGPSPRVDVRWRLGRDVVLVGEASTTHQRPLPTYLLAFPDGPYLRLERSSGGSLGARFSRGPLRVDVDGWGRWMAHLASPERDGSMGDQQGLAYGAEATLALTLATTHAQVLYAYTRSLRREEPTDAFAPTPYDQPHRVNAIVVQRLPLDLSVAGRWRFGSGFVIPEGLLAYDLLQGRDVEIDRDDAGRAKPYHALDIKISKRLPYRKWRLDLWLDVQNVYNRRVPEPAINGIDELLFAYGVGLPILPLFGVEGQFWP